jgi:hypothetical protein
MHCYSTSLKTTTTSNTPSLSNPQLLSTKFDGLFKNILKDQSIETPKKPIYRSKWTKNDTQAIKMIEKEYRQIQLNDQASISDCLDSIEDIAYRLSRIIRAQLSKAGIAHDSNNSSSRSVAGNAVFYLDGSCTISSAIGIEGIARLMQKKSDPDSVQVSVNGFEVKQTDSHIFKAADFLDDICLEIFSHRFFKQDIHKATAALVRMSCDSKKKQKTALNSLGKHCDDMLAEGNLKGVVDLYDSCLTEKNGVLLLNRLNKKLVQLDPTNKRHFETIIASLNSGYVQAIQCWIMDGVQNDKISNVTQYIDLLLQNPNLESWCLAQIITLVEKYLQEKEEDSAIKLIDKYLLKNHDTYADGMAYIDSLIKSKIAKDSEDPAIRLIDKYLFNPETYAEGMAYIHSLIKSKIAKDDEDSAIKLIDKYLLNDQGTYSEGMAYIHSLIKSKVSKDDEDAAARLIDRYLMQYVDTSHSGIEYYCQLINKKIQNKYDYSELIAKIEPFVIEILSLSNFTDHHRNILRKFVKRLSNSHTCDKVITILSFAKMKLNDQLFVKELARLFVTDMRNIDVTKANIAKSLFLSQ